MDKLVICGVDSLIGSHLALSLAGRLDVVGLYHHTPITLDGVECIAWPYSQADHIDEVLGEIKPDWIVQCGPTSLSSWDDLPEDIEDRLDRHAQLVTSIADASKRNKWKWTLCSTDAVFMGPRLFHHEQQPTSGTCLLSQVAVQTEEMAKQVKAMVIRSHAYGWSPIEGEPNYAEQLWEELSSGADCLVDAERHATPILASDLAELLLVAYQKQLHGLWHITGAERVSPFRFAAEMTRAFGLSGRQVKLQAMQSGYSNRKPLVQETSLQTRKARRALKQPMPMLREGLARFAEQAEQGWKGQMESAHQLQEQHLKAA